MEKNTKLDCNKIVINILTKTNESILKNALEYIKAKSIKLGISEEIIVIGPYKITKK